jgi:hypothetical protein
MCVGQARAVALSTLLMSTTTNGPSLRPTWCSWPKTQSASVSTARGFQRPALHRADRAHWRMMPHNVPPWPVIYQQTQWWLAAGCFADAQRYYTTPREMRREPQQAEPSGALWTHTCLPSRASRVRVPSSAPTRFPARLAPSVLPSVPAYVLASVPECMGHAAMCPLPLHSRFASPGGLVLV